MPERDKVIKGLECCSDVCCCAVEGDIPERNHNCPYYEKDYGGLFERCDMSQLMMDAIALLKPEPVQALFVTPYKSRGIKHGRCPGCDLLINSVSNKVACGRCGMFVSWDE